MSMSLYASKEEYEQAHAARWYCLDRDGVAMLCNDEDDARAQAAENDLSWPVRAPHRAVLLGDVAAERARCAKLQTALRNLLDTFHQGRAVVGQPEARGYVLAAVQAGEDALRA